MTKVKLSELAGDTSPRASPISTMDVAQPIRIGQTFAVARANASRSWRSTSRLPKQNGIVIRPHFVANRLFTRIRKKCCASSRGIRYHTI